MFCDGRTPKKGGSAQTGTMQSATSEGPASMIGSNFIWFEVGGIKNLQRSSFMIAVTTPDPSTISRKPMAFNYVIA